MNIQTRMYRLNYMCTSRNQLSVCHDYMYVNISLLIGYTCHCPLWPCRPMLYDR